jgi:hypothetical protein
LKALFRTWSVGPHHRRLVQAGGLKDGMTAALDRMPIAAILPIASAAPSG